MTTTTFPQPQPWSTLLSWLYAGSQIAQVIPQSQIQGCLERCTNDAWKGSFLWKSARCWWAAGGDSGVYRMVWGTVAHQKKITFDLFSTHVHNFSKNIVWEPLHWWLEARCLKMSERYDPAQRTQLIPRFKDIFRASLEMSLRHYYGLSDPQFYSNTAKFNQLVFNLNVINCSPVIAQFLGSRWRYRFASETVL